MFDLEMQIYFYRIYGVLIEIRVGIAIGGNVRTCDESHYYERVFDCA